MRVLITGSQSFIGRELARTLDARGIDWLGVDALPPRSARERQADIRDTGVELAGRVDAIVHLAAISRDADCRENPDLAIDVNVRGTLNLARAGAKAGIRQFVFASSEWVYGPMLPGEQRSEASPIDANRIDGAYALSKIAAERMLSIAARGEPGFDLTILRFGIVYGPRESNWSAVESLHRAAASGEEVRVGSRATARRFVHVSDVADGIALALGRRGEEVFNLTGDSLISLGDVIDRSARLHGTSPRVIESAPDRPNIRDIANTRARRELGWTPCYDLSRGLATLGGAR